MHHCVFENALIVASGRDSLLKISLATVPHCGGSTFCHDIVALPVTRKEGSAMKEDPLSYSTSCLSPPRILIRRILDRNMFLCPGSGGKYIDVT